MALMILKLLKLDKYLDLTASKYKVFFVTVMVIL